MELSRRGPGLLVRDITSGKDPQIQAVLQVLIQLNADILVLTSLDYDHDLVALNALADAAAGLGAAYPYRFALRPNGGPQTGLDLDGDGRLGEPEDAQGYGRFSGQGGPAILSRLPIDTKAVRDFSSFLWANLPGALLPDAMPGPVKAVQRLSTNAHWEVPVTLPDATRLTLLVWHATPPVFDGPEDRNGRRNHDEAAFWQRLIEGALPFRPPNDPFVLIGDANLDPLDGDGLPGAITALLRHPALQDPAPAASATRTDPGQRGDPRLDTAFFDQTGGLRVDYILPSSSLRMTGAGVLWPEDTEPIAQTLATASRHRPVWVDVARP
ncbi:MAG: endonuclease/exonuclease/phosphatase family protein [Pseudorhodobacter sp.]|nr:endonuclease/exonuclease/phosphatase family protein [Pseudorhodobacter sp.]